MNRLLVTVLKRLGAGVVILWVVSLIVFVGVELLPGDTAQQILGQAASAESLAALRSELGLDRPAVVRYVEWIGGLATGDFGISLATRTPISDLIANRLGNTLFLACYAALIAVPFAIGLGLLAALFRNTVFDRVSNVLALIAISFPEFFIGYILIYLFTQNGAFPSIASVSDTMSLGEKLYRTLLPAATLTLVVTAHMMRMSRAAVINLLASPYIEMARLKGVGPARTIAVHALPNALAPIVNVVALNLAYLITGVVVVEVVFVYPGLGQLMVDSVAKRDLPVVQTTAMIFAAAFVLLNLIADVLATVTNPRLLHPR